jgi:GNAT superfamily N-acetyltransferase
MLDMTIRPATSDDLAAINHIFYLNEVRGDPAPPPEQPVSAFRHVLETGELLVADAAADSAIVGFAGRIVRTGVAFLTDLFVAPDRQSAGLGSALLAAAFPPDLPARCTLASTDPRAHALYTRAGMRPCWPSYWVRARPAELRTLPVEGVEAVEAAPDDPALAAWDTAICGRMRPAEFAFWRAEYDAVPLWFRRVGETVGYGWIARRSPASFWAPQAYTIGPVGARTPRDAAAGVCAAVEWARTRCEALRLAVPGPHPALGPLLTAGGQIVYVETFCATAGFAVFDPERYLASGDFL